jgi:hypothetical protein
MCAASLTRDHDAVRRGVQGHLIVLAQRRSIGQHRVNLGDRAAGRELAWQFS